MRSKEIVLCPTCGSDRWRFAEAADVGALWMRGEADLTEDSGVVKLLYDSCGCVARFDGETVGIQKMWNKGRDL